MRKADNFDARKWLVENKLTTQSRLNEDETSFNITSQQKRDFINQMKSFIKDEDFDTAMEEAGNILARVLTNDEAEFIEDVEDFGYDPDQVEKYAQDLVGNLNSKTSPIEKPENYQEIIQQYIENGSKGTLDLDDYNQPTLPSNLTKVRGNLSLRGSKITSLPDNLTVKGEINLNNSALSSVPKNLKVGSFLFLVNTPLNKKYTKEELEKMLPGVYNVYASSIK